MSEQPASYGDHPIAPPIPARVDTLEHQMAQNTSAIIALVNAIDRLRTDMDHRFVGVDTRLTAIERQLEVIHQSNQLLAELLSTRLPPPPK